MERDDTAAVFMQKILPQIFILFQRIYANVGNKKGVQCLQEHYGSNQQIYQPYKFWSGTVLILLLKGLLSNK